MLFVLGCGYIGSRFLEQRPVSRADYIASTTSSSRVASLSCLAAEVVVIDGGDPNSLEQIIDRIDILTIFIAPAAGASYEEVYLRTAESIMPILQRRQKPLYVLYTSSTFVYQGCKGSLLSEESSLPLISLRAQLLFDTENTYLACQNRWVSVCILRLAGIYGPGRELPDRAGMLSGKRLPGTGLEPTNHIHQEDVVNAAWFCIDNHLTGVFNVASDSHPTRQELYHRLCTDLAIDPPLWDPTKTAEHGCGSVVCNHKIKQAGFIFTYPTI